MGRSHRTEVTIKLRTNTRVPAESQPPLVLHLMPLKVHAVFSAQSKSVANQSVTVFILHISRFPNHLGDDSQSVHAFNTLASIPLILVPRMTSIYDLIHTLSLVWGHGLNRNVCTCGACRKSVTDVVVQHLVSGGGARLRCRDTVSAVTLHDHRLAAALPGRIALYSLPTGGAETDMRYQAAGTIAVSGHADSPPPLLLLLLLPDHLLVCQVRRLQTLLLAGGLDHSCCTVHIALHDIAPK